MNTKRIDQLSDTLKEIVDNSSHINQGKIVRQFQEKLSDMAQSLAVTESNAKYLSMKTINVTSDVLLAKLVNKENLDNA